MSSSAGSSQKRKLSPDYVDSDSDYEAKQKDRRTAAAADAEQELGSPKKTADGDVYFELAAKRRVTVRKFKGTTLIDIREFWEDSGDLKPGKKGISLSVEQWDALKGLTEKIDGEIERLGKVGKRSLL